ncbi:DUF6445 family protein [Aliiglaciecola sp.]|nr:DUF6445 family protein [Aliiglaciecola sp.]
MSFSVNPLAKVEVTYIGSRQTPVIVADNFLDSVEGLLQHAGDMSSFTRQQTDYYPGARKPLPQAYEQTVKHWVESALPNILSHSQVTVDVTLCAMSLTNQSPDTLIPIQRIPHFDTPDPNQWALVHYLCAESFGGTGFFKHIRSGFETITEANQKSYFRTLADDASVSGVPRAQYLQGSNDLFDMLHSVEAKMNRLVMYPSNLLHSGLIKNWQASTPQNGRLTANAFCVVA